MSSTNEIVSMSSSKGGSLEGRYKKKFRKETGVDLRPLAVDPNRVDHRALRAAACKSVVNEPFYEEMERRAFERAQFCKNESDKELFSGQCVSGSAETQMLQ